MYDVDPSTGIVALSFSASARCDHALVSPWDGHETMALRPVGPTHLVGPWDQAPQTLGLEVSYIFFSC